MKEIRPIGLDHLFSGPIPDKWQSGGGMIQSDVEVSIGAAGPSANWTHVGLYPKDGALRWGFAYQITSNSAAGLSGIRFGSLCGERTDIRKLVIGFKLTKGNVPPAAPSSTIFGFRATAPAGATPQVTDNIIMTAGGAELTEGYYEIEIRPYAGVGGYGYDLWRDGEKIATGTGINTNAMTPANLRNCYFTLGVANGALCSANGRVMGDYMADLSNIYAAWSNDINDDIRQGPVKVRRLPLLQANVEAWPASTGGAANSVLNAAPSSSTNDAPYLTTDAANTPLKFKVDASGVKSTEKVLALSGGVLAWRDAGVVGTLSLKWAKGTDQSAAVSFTPSNGAWDTRRDVRSAILATAPGGTVLDKANLSTLELILSPNA